jgi:hypothetical protein
MIFGVPDFDTGLSTAVYSHLLTCSSEAVQEPEAGVKAMETCLIELYLVFGSFFFCFYKYWFCHQYECMLYHATSKISL